jgi:hypothetical protein
VIEALIGHMKPDGLLDRNWLKGQAGDAMHVVLCAAGQNLRLILRAIEAFFAPYLPQLRRGGQGDARLQRRWRVLTRVWDTLMRCLTAWLGHLGINSRRHLPA